MKGVLVFCSLILMSVEDNEVAVIRSFSSSIGEMVLECQSELEFKNDVIRDLLDFWNETNDLTSADLGCALVCVFEKNEFLNEDGNQVQQKNVVAFYKVLGAGELMSEKMVELFLLCKKSTSTIRNMCDSALEIAKCFRYGIFMMHWAPERNYWKHTELSPGSETEQDASLRREMNRRKLFTMLFRSCQK